MHYTGKLEDGTVFDSSQGGQPLSFTLGAGQVIAGFEEAVEGMKQGESKTTHIPAEEAYGPHRDDLVIEVPRDQIPAELNPEVGQQLQLRQEGGQDIPVVVREVTEGSITLDANHPLAGKSLIFEIELVEIG